MLGLLKWRLFVIGTGVCLTVSQVGSDVMWPVSTSVSDSALEAGVYIMFPWAGVPGVTVESEVGEVTVSWPVYYCALNFIVLFLYVVDFVILVTAVYKNTRVGATVALVSSLVLLLFNITVKAGVWVWLTTAWGAVTGNSDVITSKD